jgi:non-lysosomal glucosylceramidase
VDSVHNDYQRHLPYLFAAPAYEYSKFREYAIGAAADGHIQEYLGSFGLSPLDSVGGRTMADTTTLWITELYEFYVNTADLAFVQEMWPTAQRAIAWQIGVSQKIGLPVRASVCVCVPVFWGRQGCSPFSCALNSHSLTLSLSLTPHPSPAPWHLVGTDDSLQLEQYNTTTYNSFLHLLALKAGSTLARIVGDAATASAAEAAYVRAQGAITDLLWNSNFSYFRAYTGGDAVMTDALYGQAIALHHGLGWMFDQSKLASHLAAELKYNSAEPYGLVTVTGRDTPPPDAVESSPPSPRVAAALAAAAAVGADGRDNVLWGQAGPTFSVMQLRLAKAAGPAFAPLTPAAIDAALLPSLWQLDNTRTRLHNLWNYAGIYTGATADWGDESARGIDYTTSKYGFALVSYYLFSAQTGQQFNLPNGTLAFDPVYPCPYTLPVLLLGVEGTLVCTGSTAAPDYTLALAFGSLQLPAGGLSAAGKVNAAPVSLEAGQSVSW